MSETAVAYCAWCLLPDCDGRHPECSPPVLPAHEDVAGAAGGVVCVCDRPMPMEDGLCLKCGREVPGHG